MLHAADWRAHSNNAQSTEVMPNVFFWPQTGSLAIHDVRVGLGKVAQVLSCCCSGPFSLSRTLS